MRYYFAGAYARRKELQGLASEIERSGIGARVISGWLNHTQADDDNDAGFSDFSDPRIADLAWEYGMCDMDDVLSAQAIVSFTGQGGRGGRHVEHGMAILLNRMRPVTGYRLIVIGPREHVFHCHPATEHFATWVEFLRHEIRRNREENEG